ncbi:MAG TPA: hypothetical protein VFG04_08570 [Planctomycetaceae bacterium]|nr:hypothetical protein [Planctomycetaceae bacterium]
MQGVYESFGWIDAARSFRIRTEYSFIPTEAKRRWEEKHPPLGEAPGTVDLRTFCLDSEWAWDKTRIHYSYENHYVGDPKSTYGCQKRIWDGSLAISRSERSDHSQLSYAFDNKLGIFFDEQNVTTQLMLPWGPGGPHHFWWLSTDVAAWREAAGLLPRDFELVGRETINSKPCYVVESWIGGYRLAVGVADGRLYRRTWLLAVENKPGYDQKAIFQKVAGPTVKSYQGWVKWCEALDPAGRSRAIHQLHVAEAEYVRSKRAAFHQFFDDYRQVSPGHWLPFRQFVIQYNTKAPEPFVESRIEQKVTTVSVDEPLPMKLFQIELQDGVPVTTDWRYDPPIHYEYRKAQTEAERIALRDLERRKRH